jgi:NAD(P)-dependent dehydrogenase (short-subunit alcohol dehydrogenase family)
MRLKDKVAVITGGAHGMGDAEARLFAAEGAKIVVADILGADAEAVAAEIRTRGGEAIAATIDVTREDDWNALIGKTLAAYGRLDILVNNAGISGSSVGNPDGLEGWHRIIAVNQTSVFLGTKLAAEQMAKTGGGSIVNISSLASVKPTPVTTVYAAAKAGLNALTTATAIEYAQVGVRVNGIICGTFDTDAASGFVRDPALLPDILRPIALDRVGHPEEIVGAVIYLLSGASSYTTGSLMTIDGGVAT